MGDRKMISRVRRPGWPNRRPGGNGNERDRKKLLRLRASRLWLPPGTIVPRSGTQRKVKSRLRPSQSCSSKPVNFSKMGNQVPGPSEEILRGTQPMIELFEITISGLLRLDHCVRAGSRPSQGSLDILVCRSHAELMAPHSSTSYSKATPSGSFALNHRSAPSR